MLSVHFSCSILTRIFPWGVPGPPLLRNRGPVRTFGGQSYSKWSLKYLPDPTWRTRRFWFDNDAYTNLQHIRGNNKINNNKIKSRSFDNMFFIHFNKQNVGVLQYRSKVSWQSRLETWFSILEVFENRELSFDARESSFEDRESSFQDRVSRHSKNLSRISNRDFEETISFLKTKQ